jgi:hypothetical protein
MTDATPSSSATSNSSGRVNPYETALLAIGVIALVIGLILLLASGPAILAEVLLLGGFFAIVGWLVVAGVRWKP